MKHVLLDNAYEAWAMAIKYCNIILNGQATLQYQKFFVSSLHNAVELFIKQLMLNNGDHSVATIQNIKNSDDAELILKYMKSTDLNEFFANLSAKELERFKSIDFKDLIDKHKKMMAKSMGSRNFTIELKMLQQLRNNETHFMISKTNYLTEDQFMCLHNFMIDFYAVLEDMQVFSFWGEPFGENKRLRINRTPISGFSYKQALQQSTQAQRIADLLNGSYEYGNPNYSAYEIAENLCQICDSINIPFEEVWSIIEMMKSLNLITYQEVSEELPDDELFTEKQVNVYYLMGINL